MARQQTARNAANELLGIFNAEWLIIKNDSRGDVYCRINPSLEHRV